MALKVNEGKEFETPPVCTTVARLVDVWDEGWRDMAYPDAKKAWIEDRQLRFTYLTSEKMSDGRPFAIAEWVTINKRDKTGRTADGGLYKKDGKSSKFVDRIEALISANIETLKLLDYDDEVALAEAMIGKGCLIAVTHKENGREKVDKVMALPRGVAPAEGEFQRKKDRPGEKTADPIENMDEKKRIAMLWSAASNRAKAIGDPSITSETILRNLYDEFKIAGGTHAAVKLPTAQLRLVVDSIEGWDAPTVAQEPVDDDEIPF